MIELKCVDRLASEHTAQCLNYMRASGRSLWLLINFQKPKAEWKRIVHVFKWSRPRPRFWDEPSRTGAEHIDLP